ncbi:hypothetical protein ACMD2_21835 [Ananas comosus]|uniref:Uncharacterized protein n=1 Tax=Ananas comosus TaxID=4615 RepID=A0A199V954_ANACO|nr:hypothetical protein ACMD2_21835 [Ananas comosus]
MLYCVRTPWQHLAVTAKRSSSIQGNWIWTPLSSRHAALRRPSTLRPILPRLESSRAIHYDPSPGELSWRPEGRAAAATNTGPPTNPPPPNPPPARWRRPSIEIHYRDRCSANDKDDDVFSDAAEKVSLSENLNVACRMSSFDGMATKDIEEIVNRSRPRPSYIMERFLPAANAIANSLALNQHNKEDEKELSTRACGVMLFFPWSLRPIACGFKSPARSTAPSGPNDNVGSLFTPRSMRSVSNETHLDNVEGTNSGSFDVDKKSSVRECHSPGWGLSFLDRRRKGMRCVVERKREKGSEKSKKDIKHVSKCREGNWRMPQLKAPSEPWLSHALNTINKKN